MKILIPMAGNGQRFVDAGFSKPKPLIDVLGKPMIQRVIENLGGPTRGEYIFVVQAAHDKKWDIIKRVQEIVPDASFISITEPTAGAACTALLARDFINNDEPLLIANADQVIEWRAERYVPPSSRLLDGLIYTFEAHHPKWSYAAVDPRGWVWGVAEKQVISDRATCGIYWFCRGRDFVRGAEQMIAKNLRVNNEFYIAPVFNQLIRWGHDVMEMNVRRMWGLGTPEDLRAYEDAHRS